MISNTGPDRIFNFLSTVLAKKIHRIWIETSGADKYILHLVGGLENESYFSQILGNNHHPNRLPHIFQRGRAQPPSIFLFVLAQNGGRMGRRFRMWISGHGNYDPLILTMAFWWVYSGFIVEMVIYSGFTLW